MGGPLDVVKPVLDKTGKLTLKCVNLLYKRYIALMSCVFQLQPWSYRPNELCVGFEPKANRSCMADDVGRAFLYHQRSQCGKD